MADVGLLILGGLTIFIFVERFMAIRKASEFDMNFMNRIRDYIFGRQGRCCGRSLPQDQYADRPYDRKGYRPDRSSDERRESAIENVANLEVSKLETNLPILATIAGGAPDDRFSRYGGRHGADFMDMAAAGGTVDMSLLSSGMYVAMITTVGGLLVGIPAYFGYNYLVARIEKARFPMEANSIAFMDILNQPVQK